MSLPPREAWIEIPPFWWPSVKKMSLPPREAWIEIHLSVSSSQDFASLPPREAWIEIHLGQGNRLQYPSRFPRGKRGLKFSDVQIVDTHYLEVASPAGSVD